MKKFNILYEEIMENSQKQIKSFQEFRHFCKELNLIVELHKLDEQNQKNQKFLEASLFFMKKINDKAPVRFEFYNQFDQDYVSKHLEIFNELNKFKKQYLVTLDGTDKSPYVIWG